MTSNLSRVIVQKQRRYRHLFFSWFLDWAIRPARAGHRFFSLRLTPARISRHRGRTRRGAERRTLQIPDQPRDSLPQAMSWSTGANDDDSPAAEICPSTITGTRGRGDEGTVLLNQEKFYVIMSPHEDRCGDTSSE